VSTQPSSLARLALALLFASALASSASAAPSLAEPSATRADFALRSGGVTSRLRIQTASLLPGETLDLSAVDRTGAPLPIQVVGVPGLERLGPDRVRFRADQLPGVHRLEIRSPDAREGIELNVFVQVPSARVHGAALNGYTIGRYPTSDPKSPPPDGFIEVTEANHDTPVSPHFRLGDFLCKESGGYPKYLVLDPRLPAKLEALLESARAAGLHAPTFTVMSGYRTPAYHHAIGNTTGFSRHLWGAGADVFIDANGDGKMDDLDGNGLIDQRDAAVLFALADALDREPAEDWTVGGASAYRATDSHGPFVHVDVRGRAARW
jgi:hypothetical protein